MPVPIAVAPMLISQIRSDSLLQPLLVLAEHDRIGGEFLAQRHRHRVLQLGAAHLDDVLELLCLAPRTTARSTAMASTSCMIPA